MTRSRLLYSLLSVALAFILLYWSVRGIQWTTVWQSLLAARPPHIGACSLLFVVALFLRAARWRILLSASGPVPMLAAFWATSAGYFGNNFLPARAGELIRTMMISSRLGLSRMFVLTTVLSERMVDAVTLVLVSAGVLLALPSRPGWLAEAAKPLAVIGFSGVLALAILPRFQLLYQRILGRIPVSCRTRMRLLRLVENALLGMRSFHNRRRLFGFLGLTTIIWLSDAVNALIAARSLGLPVTLPTAFLLVAGLGLGSALPSTPGYVGVYQFVAVNILTPLGSRREDSIAFILLFQALQFVMTAFWGLLAFRQSRRATTATEARLAAALGGLGMARIASIPHIKVSRLSALKCLSLLLCSISY